MTTCSNCKQEVLEGLPYCPHCGSKQKTIENDNTFVAEDPYEIFQISHDAESEIIEAVYKSLAKKYHPDNGINGNDERIKKINWAYSILRDKEKRSRWDSEHPGSAYNKSASQQIHDKPVASQTILKTNGQRLTITIITFVSLIVTIFLTITVSNYHREYNKMSSFYATSNAQVISKDYSLNQNSTKISQLTSTIAAQSKTQVANELTIDTQEDFLTSSGIPFQMSSGSLLHYPNDNYVKTYCIGEYKDFMAEVVFINPYKSTYNAGWDYGFIFSNKASADDLRLVFSSDSRWALHEGISNPIESGWIKNFVISENGQNKLRLVVFKDLVSFYVNGTYINAISLSSEATKGEVCIATGLYNGNEAQGEYTEYLNFIVNPIISIK